MLTHLAQFTLDLHTGATWTISLASIALILIRPKGLGEAWWATAGATLLILCGLISPARAWRAAGEGLDVYLFLIGMMIVSELARREGVFDWVATHAVRAARGSQSRLFALIYVAGTVITVLLSNDATAVVLTPAVLAAVRAAGAEPLPYLMICAVVANAASFVLPISNPANLVVYHRALPPLGRWLVMFGLSSVVSILMTFVVLRWLSRRFLAPELRDTASTPPLTPAGKLTLYGIALLALTLMTASTLNLDLGAPACAAALLVAALISLRDRDVFTDIAREVSWSVVPLVAALFVVVEALNSAGALQWSVAALRAVAGWPAASAALASSFGIAIVSNVMNNLPSGLIGGTAIKAAAVTGVVRTAVLIGIDLGPNLSVSGSLATILWLIAIRREGQHVGFWQFLKWGALVMPPALALAVLAAFLIQRH